MSTSSGPGGYVTYDRSKRLSTASVSSFTIPRPHSPTSTRPHGLVRPASSPSTPTTAAAAAAATGPESPLRQPQPFRPPATFSAWSHTGVSSTSTPPPAASTSTSGRPTPIASALPFSTVSPGNSPFPPASPNRTQSQSPAATGNATPNGQGRAGERVRAPYHTAFQPQGVRRDCTEEFMAGRRSRGESKKLDEGRLGRRLEKLVALHFPPPTGEEHSAPAPSRPTTFASISAFGESLRGKSAKEIWSSVAGSKGELERAEQGIVKWQDDAEATRCPICMASFGLTTRRHHCRLCGRVVCFLPPTLPALPSHAVDVASSASPAVGPPPIPTPTRRERCSTFLTYEYDGTTSTAGGGSSGEKKPLGMVVEIEPVEPDLTLGGVVNDRGAPPKEKDERKKVRVCRECLNTVLRQQLKTLPVRTPTWLKLYEVLVQLEKEIEEVLPEFQELVLSISKPSTAAPSSANPSAKHAQTLRKRLLTILASYDTISKRMRDLPLVDGSLPGGSQDRLQRAIASRGTLFLSEKLGLLRSLGNMEEISGSTRKKAPPKETQTVKTLASLLGEEGASHALVNEKVGAELEASGKLAVLLEQEQLVASYVDDANSRRQFEDAASLKASLDELREEIRRVRATLT